MAHIFKKIASGARNTTTYKIGLLQTKAFRILKMKTSEGLAIHALSTIEWALLGLLYDTKESLAASTIADELGVEASFISVLIKKLQNQKLISVEINEDDSRSKEVSLSTAGRELVPKIEKELRQSLRGLVAGSSVSDILSYIAVLEAIIKNDSK